jgi:hypothetical protein
MLLGVKERFVLQRVLPVEGNLITLRIVRDLQRELGFSEEELAKIGFVTEGAQTTWNVDGDIAKDVPIGEVAKGVIVDALKELETSKRLPMDCLDVYEKFVEG